jgi:cytochrome c peroxidase
MWRLNLNTIRPSASSAQDQADREIRVLCFSIFVCFWLLTSDAVTQQTDGELLSELQILRGLPRLPDEAANTNISIIRLGRQLFFDRRLSVDGSVSCATCHDPQHGWTGRHATAVGFRGEKQLRRAPSLFNVAWAENLFWDGRATSLENQALQPLVNPGEMGEQTLSSVVGRIAQVPEYLDRFREAFNGPPSVEGIGNAIAAFERTILAGDAPVDRFRAGDRNAMSTSAQRGLKLFYGKAHCGACHAGSLFTDRAFHNIGIGVDSIPVDEGRKKISGLEGDRASFKTPGLRNVALHPPYMHDGSLTSLDTVIDFYNNGGLANDQLDEEVFPLNLTARQKRDLRTFLLEGLTSFDAARSAIGDRRRVR